MFYVTGLIVWLIIAIAFLILLHDYLHNFSHKSIRFIYTHIYDTIMLPFYFVKVSFYEDDLSIRTLSFLKNSKRFQSKILFKYISYRLKKKGVSFYSESED